jgi:hypothetical protein
MSLCRPSVANLAELFTINDCHPVWKLTALIPLHQGSLLDIPSLVSLMLVGVHMSLEMVLSHLLVAT